MHLILWVAGEVPEGEGVVRLGAGALARRVLRDGLVAARRFAPASPRMHAVFFDLKRAYHSTLRLTRRLLKRLGLTAARFDLLYIVEKAGKTKIGRAHV